MGREKRVSLGLLLSLPREMREVVKAAWSPRRMDIKQQNSNQQQTRLSCFLGSSSNENAGRKKQYRMGCPPFAPPRATETSRMKEVLDGWLHAEGILYSFHDTS